ncbi:hypothetical protein PBY51_015415 [Eleginops maclovinus]|uniref:Uncharacterized protein n=1 Tax=Eleginops maclovinus TaxID=56733 RepID=A0AAN8A8U3_ELEMC|nr:hypothetical protein PBY51_015415 [Eleginops maclovinus]
METEVPKIKVEIKNPEDESTQAVVETPKVEVEKKEPEEFILKKAEEVVLQKEKSRKKNKQNKKKDNKLEVKLPETQAEKTHTFETVWGDVITKPVESTKEPETPNCWNVKFTPIWMKEQQTKDNLAKKDQICETTDLPMTESAAVSQQQMESGEETTLSWAAVVAKKDQICETAEVEEEEKETEEFPALTMTKAAEIGLQKMESGEETTLSWAAVVAKKAQSCETTEVEDEEKETEEFPSYRGPSLQL